MQVEKLTEDLYQTELLKQKNYNCIAFSQIVYFQQHISLKPWRKQNTLTFALFGFDFSYSDGVTFLTNLTTLNSFLFDFFCLISNTFRDRITKYYICLLVDHVSGPILQHLFTYLCALSSTFTLFFLTLFQNRKKILFNLRKLRIKSSKLSFQKQGQVKSLKYRHHQGSQLSLIFATNINPLMGK